MFKQIRTKVRTMIEIHKVKNNFAKCIFCTKGDDIYIRETGENAPTMSITPLANDIIKINGVCKEHQEQLTNGQNTSPINNY